MHEFLLLIVHPCVVGGRYDLALALLVDPGGDGDRVLRCQFGCSIARGEGGRTFWEWQ